MLDTGECAFTWWFKRLPVEFPRDGVFGNPPRHAHEQILFHLRFEDDGRETAPLAADAD